MAVRERSQKSMTLEKEAAYLKALNDALDAGYRILEKRGMHWMLLKRL